MSQREIMNYLDKHPGKFYTAKELYFNMGITFSYSVFHSGLRKALKRREYVSSIVMCNNTKRLTALYGRKEE